MVKSSHLKAEVPKYNFEILLRDKYPFQQPLIMTKTKVSALFIQFCEPSIADGRDLLKAILPKEQSEWLPSMNLYELIQSIPSFIEEHVKPENLEKSRVQQVGEFHLGLKYDINLWVNSQDCHAYPAQEEKKQEEIEKTRQGNFIAQKKTFYVDM